MKDETDEALRGVEGRVGAAVDGETDADDGQRESAGRDSGGDFFRFPQNGFRSNGRRRGRCLLRLFLPSRRH
jgi:hypothetical protein